MFHSNLTEVAKCGLVYKKKHLHALLYENIDIMCIIMGPPDMCIVL